MQDSVEASQMLEQLKQATQKSEEYRSKLHGAIRKGKASEAARIGLEKEVEELKARLSQQNAVQASTAASESSAEQNRLSAQGQEGHAALQAGQSTPQTTSGQDQHPRSAATNGVHTANGHPQEDGDRMFSESQKVKDLQSQLSKWREQCNDAEQNADILREALQAAAEKVQEAEEAASDARREASQAEQDAAESRDSAEQRGEEAADLRKRLAILEGRLTGLSDLEAELASSSKKLEESRDEVETFREDSSRLASQLKSQHGELELLTAQLRTLEEEKAVLEQQARLQASSDADGFSEAKQQLHQELEAARAAQETAQKEADLARSMKDEVTQAKQAAEHRVVLAEEAMQKVQAEDARRKQKFALLHSAFAQEKDSILERLKASESEANALKDRCQTVERLEDDLASRTEELSEAKEAVKELELDLSRLRGDSKQQAERLGSVTSLLEHTQKRLQLAEGSAEESRTECQNLAAMLEDVSVENDGLKTELEAIGAKLKSAESELQDLRDSAQEPSQINQTGVSDKQAHISERIASTDTEDEEIDRNAVIAELERELHSVRDSLRMQTRLANNASGFQARLATMEKQNQELQWQITMMNHDPEIGTAPPQRVPQPPKNVPAAFLNFQERRAWDEMLEG